MKIKNEKVGIVVIGRNEGIRLKRSLKSVQAQADFIVYVDSASDDNSVEFAQSIGIDVLNLDMSIPFSAGRARNEGFEWLLKKYPQLDYIQFIDGDCELCMVWLEFAFNFLQTNTSCAIAAGRRKEKYPENSIYNLLCDIEWDTPIGETNACGGDSMIRKEAFLQVNGFNPEVIAGEEPELCYRLKKKGWTIYRLDHLMTLHDADITRFSQWWKRMLRTGHAYAQGFVMHGNEGDGYCRKPSLKIWLYALIIPMIVFFLTIFNSPYYLWLFFVYIAQLGWIGFKAAKKLKNVRHSAVYAAFIIIAKWPQCVGQLFFLYRKIFQHEFEVIEYQ